jgi:hypothetical protein
MNFQIVKFQLDLITQKIKGTSLFIHQSLKALLKQHETQINGVPKEQPEETMRRIIGFVRQNEDAFETWSTATKQQFPHLEKLCNRACFLNSRIMTSNYIDSSSNQPIIYDFWRRLFAHFLKISFIHPQFFISQSYTLEHIIAIIENSLNDFIATHVQLDIEKPTLTMEDLKTMEDLTMEDLKTMQDFQEDDITNSKTKNQRSKHYVSKGQSNTLAVRLD